MLGLLILFVSVAASISLVAFSIYTGITPMPSSQLVKKEVVKLISKQSGTIYELGSGWGGLALLLAKSYPDSKVLAFELSPIPFFCSQFLKKIFKVKNLNIYRKNFFHVPLNDADVVVCYLYPGAMTRLREKLSEELNEEAIVISNFFSIIGWQFERQIPVKDHCSSNIFLYRFIRKMKK